MKRRETTRKSCVKNTLGCIRSLCGDAFAGEGPVLSYGKYGLFFDPQQEVFAIQL